MSKVYSFRLDDNNLREKQAREVIKTLIGKGYSLRHIVVEALIYYQQSHSNNRDFNDLLGELQTLICAVKAITQERNSGIQGPLTDSFLQGIKQSFKSGVKIK